MTLALVPAAPATDAAFVAIFGVFILAMVALIVVVIVWAVRHDLAGREAWRRRQEAARGGPHRHPGPGQ